MGSVRGAQPDLAEFSERRPGVIIAVGVTVPGRPWRLNGGVVDGSMSVGDMVLVNAYLIQLYRAVEFSGFVYREIKHSLADMERMFTLLEQGEVADRPALKPGHRQAGHPAWSRCSLATTVSGGFCDNQL